MLPTYYEFYNPVKINAGKEALETIPYELKLLSCNRPIIITDKGVADAGLIKIVLNAFNNSDITVGAVYDKTPPDSSLNVVNEICEIYKQNSCDSIIAVGGGSAIDTAKGVNIVISENDSDIKKFMGVDRLTKAQRPLFVVPTTSGTGSEVTVVAVIADTENNVKLPFTSNLLMPKIAFLDPRMTLSLPPRITAATGMDAVTHAVEAYTCLQKNPMSDAYAVSAIKLIAQNIVEAVSNGKNADARFAMANASAMAGIAFSNSMVGAVHAIGHACGAVAHVHHGNAMAVLLPYVMNFNIDKIENLYAELLYAFDPETDSKTPYEQKAGKTVDFITRLNNKLNNLCGMPVKLSDAGVKPEQIETIAKTALNDGALMPNPKHLDINDIINIIKNAM